MDPTIVAAESSGDPAPDLVTPGRSVPRWTWTALVGASLVLLLAAALLRPGGSVQADRTETTPIAYGPIPALVPGDRVEQRFVAGDDGLSAVTVRFGTYGRIPTCVLDVSLVDDTGTTVDAAPLACTDLPDSTPLEVLSFAPISGSDGRWYSLHLDLRDDPSEPITLFGSPATSTKPAATVDGTAIADALDLTTGYGDDAVAATQLDTAFNRIGQHGPFWREPASVVLLVLACIALLTAMTIVPRRWALVLLVGFAVTKGLFWSAIVPPMIGVDERAHIAYAQYLAVDHAIPKRERPANDRPSYSTELATLDAVFRQVAAARGDRPDYGADGVAPDRELLESVRGQDGSNGDTPASGYTPAYYAVPAAIYDLTPGTIDVKVGAMRLWSIALGAVTAVAAVLLGRRLFDRDSVALMLGVGVACHPMLSQQTAIVNNDALVIATGALLTLIAVALTAPDRSRWWAAAAGATFGIAMLGKPLAAAFFPVLVVAWIIGRWRGARNAPWWWEIGAAGLGVVVTYGPWFVLSTFFGYAGVGIPFVDGPDRGVRPFLHNLAADSFGSIRANWIDQFWGNFGWINQPYDDAIHRIILVAVLIGAALVAAWVVVSVFDAFRARRGAGPWRTAAGASLAAGTAVCVLVVSATLAQLYVLMFQYFMRVGSMEFIQGRYALMTVPAVLVLPVLALRRLAPRLPSLVPMTVITASMVVLNVIGAGLVIERWYL